MSQPQKPNGASDSARPSCAYCGSTDTELISLFGQTLMGSQYYCKTCHTVFEAVRWTDTLDHDENGEPNR